MRAFHRNVLRSMNASLFIVYMVEAGDTPVESPVLITSLYAPKGEPTSRITGVLIFQGKAALVMVMLRIGYGLGLPLPW